MYIPSISYNTNNLFHYYSPVGFKITKIHLKLKNTCNLIRNVMKESQSLMLKRIVYMLMEKIWWFHFAEMEQFLIVLHATWKWFIDLVMEEIDGGLGACFLFFYVCFTHSCWSQTPCRFVDQIQTRKNNKLSQRSISLRKLLTKTTRCTKWLTQSYAQSNC